MKKILFSLLMLVSFLSSAQCNLGFNDLITALRSNETNLKYQLSNKGYTYDYRESRYYCGDEKYELIKSDEGGVLEIKYMMPSSSYEIQKIINDAKNYGMEFPLITTNPNTGLPKNIYGVGIGNLMMQIQNDEKYSHIVIIGK